MSCAAIAVSLIDELLLLVGGLSLSESSEGCGPTGLARCSLPELRQAKEALLVAEATLEVVSSGASSLVSSCLTAFGVCPSNKHAILSFSMSSVTFTLRFLASWTNSARDF
eukprot:2799774-Pyramimonas_sp.AAC.1